MKKILLVMITIIILAVVVRGSAIGVRIGTINKGFNYTLLTDEAFVNESGDTMTGRLYIDGDLNATGNITSENVFLPAYIRNPSNESQTVTVAGIWINVTFDKKQTALQQNIGHIWDDATNTTFTINDGGVYSVLYRFAFVDTAPAPNAHIGMRLANLSGSIVKGSYDEVDTYRTDEQVLNTHAFLTEFNDGDKFLVQFTSDKTTVSTEVHTTFEKSGSSVQINLHKIANSP